MIEGMECCSLGLNREKVELLCYHLWNESCSLSINKYERKLEMLSHVSVLLIHFTVFIYYMSVPANALQISVWKCSPLLINDDSKCVNISVIQNTDLMSKMVSQNPYVACVTRKKKNQHKI